MMKRSFWLILSAVAAAIAGLALAGCTPPAEAYKVGSLDEVEVKLTAGADYTELTWPTVDGYTFTLYRSATRFGAYTAVAEGLTEGKYRDDKRFCYYRLDAADGSGAVKKQYGDIAEEIELFGGSTYVLSPGDDAAAVKEVFDDAYEHMENFDNYEFTERRFAALFKPGEYDDSIELNMGYYMTAHGLGASPEDVSVKKLYVKNGSVGNACVNFWRGAENLTVRSDTVWAVSQGVFLRTVKIEGDLALSEEDEHNPGYASGGFLGDSLVTGKTISGRQQQWLSRNSEWNRWEGATWNMCFAGVKNAPSGNYPNPPHTVEAATTLREKPFLVFDDNGYRIAVPALRDNASGISWKDNAGRIERYVEQRDIYFARSDVDTAATINAAIASGKSIVLTPGVYVIDEPVVVNKSGAVVLGIGMPTLRCDLGQSCLVVKDCSNVSISGFILDAGAFMSPTLATIGTRGGSESDIRLYDAFLRVGGPFKTYCGAECALEFNASDSACDNMWIWRADHGVKEGDACPGIAWNMNEGITGCRFYGDNVTVYGLASEHFMEHDVEWYGEHGKVFFYQSEIAYDVPSQSDWMNGNSNGYSSFHVDYSVSEFKASGLGIYSNFHVADLVLDAAMTVPYKEGIVIEHICTVSINSFNGVRGGIAAIVNERGAAVGIGQAASIAYLESYTGGQ